MAETLKGKAIVQNLPKGPTTAGTVEIEGGGIARFLGPDADPVRAKATVETAKAHRNIKHPALAPLVGAGTDDSRGVYLAHKKIPGAQLGQAIRTLDENAQAALLRQVIDGVATLHAEQLSHGAIAAHNILVADGSAVLLDVGYYREGSSQIRDAKDLAQLAHRMDLPAWLARVFIGDNFIDAIAIKNAVDAATPSLAESFATAQAAMSRPKKTAARVPASVNGAATLEPVGAPVATLPDPEPEPVPAVVYEPAPLTSPEPPQPEVVLPPEVVPTPAAVAVTVEEDEAPVADSFPMPTLYQAPVDAPRTPPVPAVETPSAPTTAVTPPPVVAAPAAPPAPAPAPTAPPVVAAVPSGADPALIAQLTAERDMFERKLREATDAEHSLQVQLARVTVERDQALAERDAARASQLSTQQAAAAVAALAATANELTTGIASLGEILNG